ncbi:hypothetical protein G6F64_015525 [Rhizopus arrhizus]|uniref:Uncharacterized protein n=1 Tax=Rhizopus oryzae TaxID=64495 RepID=A0A9P6WR69_RHIOR|nr:hypothetical protein G6F64_015525 [Rhizopus arrhizus]KAG1367315.1 hypothetical protein G6F59_018793 [Rhizopus arrhizus]
MRPPAGRSDRFRGAPGRTSPAPPGSLRCWKRRRRRSPNPLSAALSLVDSTAISSAPGMRGASKWLVTTVLPTEPE